MKKIVSLVLIIISLFLITSCSKEYPPVKSTKEEARVVFTIGTGNNKYDVKYELYRSFFLNYKSEVDGGDESVWSGDDKDSYVDAVNAMIMDRIVTIYATLSFAKELGIDPYSKEFEEKISEYVKIGVEGNGGDIEGYGGNYEAYLLGLKEMNMNYAVSELLIRYDLALAAINEYYYGVTDPILGKLDGNFEASEEAVKNYYFGDESVRVIHIFFAEGVKTDAEMLEIKDDLDHKTTSLDIGLYIINNSSALESDIIVDKKLSGMMIGKYALEPLYYSEYTETAFSMEDGSTSEIIKIKGSNPGNYIIHKLPKSEEHLKNHFDTVKTSYIDNVIGKSIEDIKADMLSEVKYTDTYKSLSHKDISMK